MPRKKKKPQVSHWSNAFYNATGEKEAARKELDLLKLSIDACRRKDMQYLKDDYTAIVKLIPQSKRVPFKDYVTNLVNKNNELIRTIDKCSVTLHRLNGIEDKINWTGFEEKRKPMAKSAYLKSKEEGKMESSRFFNEDNKVFTKKSNTDEKVEPKLFFEQKNFKLFQGSNLDVLPMLPDNSIDAIVTDPPYELGFMSKGWDSSGIAYNKELWKECLRVLKHGGHLLAFSGSRTYHRMTVAIEDAGFEIRDQIMWIYGSGFPKAADAAKLIDKSKNYEGAIIEESFDDKGKRKVKIIEHSEEAKEWLGYKSALKPAHEPIVLARKPLEKGLNIIQNLAKWGVGALNINASRIPHNNDPDYINNMNGNQRGIKKDGESLDIHGGGWKKDTTPKKIPKGRYPANIIHDGSQEVLDAFPDTKKGGAIHKDYKIDNKIYGDMSMLTSNHTDGYGDSGSAARFFYSAKAKTKDRDQGLKGYKSAKVSDGRKKEVDNAYQRGKKKRLNIHPTVKPTELMQYLVDMITPPNGTVLDPFMGSGSTGKGAMVSNILKDKNYQIIGIELTKEYLPIARDRIILGSAEYAKAELRNQPKVTIKKEVAQSQSLILEVPQEHKNKPKTKKHIVESQSLISFE